MSVNKYQPHILVLPEDDANNQVANGFLLEIPPQSIRKIQVLPEAGGWLEVLHRFQSDHSKEMERYPHRLMVLLIDFDKSEERLQEVKTRIPSHLTDRVFVLGALSEPEDLPRANLGSFETIGRAMARDCLEETDTVWGHQLLRHNSNEIDRLRQHVLPILFPPS